MQIYYKFRKSQEHISLFDKIFGNKTSFGTLIYISTYFCAMNTSQEQSYIQVTWKASPEIQEVIISVVTQVGFESFEQKEYFLYGYIDSSMFKHEDLRAILREYPFIQDIPYEIKYIHRENWNIIWETNFAPVSLYPDLLIRAEHHDDKEDKKYKQVIQIRPKMAFGTGHHETTQMMLKTMKKLDFKHKTVLDVGCGSGILSIYASFLGASHILAIDIDTWCIENSQENAALNKVKNIDVHLGEVNSLSFEHYDIILANINRNVIISQLNTYTSMLDSKGYMLISGFLSADVVIIENEVKNFSLNIVDKLEDKDWVCMTLQK